MVHALLERFPDLEFSVSCTTRPARPGEVDGRDYRFVTPEEFQALILEDAFLEWADVYGKRYGTLAAPIEEARREGRTVLLELDPQGSQSVKVRVPDAVLVFLAPASIEDLRRRLRERGTEDGGEIERRLVEARLELEASEAFDHVVVNDVLERAVDEVAGIIEGVSTEEPS